MFTKERAAAFLPLMQALANGKTIQVNMLVGYPAKREWRDAKNPCFSGKPEDYRVKPEPKIEHRYVNVYGNQTKDVGCSFQTDIIALRSRKSIGTSEARLLKIVYTDDVPTSAEFIPYPDEESKDYGC